MFIFTALIQIPIVQNLVVITSCENKLTMFSTIRFKSRLRYFEKNLVVFEKDYTEQMIKLCLARIFHIFGVILINFWMNFSMFH